MDFSDKVALGNETVNNPNIYDISLWIRTKTIGLRVQSPDLLNLNAWRSNLKVCTFNKVPQ